MFIALLSLIFRKGNFYNSFIPKPFEVLFSVLIILTAVYLLTNKKAKDFLLSIPKNIWIAGLCLVGSIVVGWLAAIFIKGIPITLNNVLEFGTFAIGILSFIAVLFYTKNDAVSSKRYLYALLLPAGYVLFLFFPWMNDNAFFDAAGRFLGLTINPNIISKTLLIPALFFITYSLFDLKKKWLKVAAILVSAGIVSLLFWISSRGALLSLVAGCVLLWIVFSLHSFSWKRAFYSGSLIVLIILIGFSITPNARKKVVVNRILNSDTTTPRPEPLTDESLTTIVQVSLENKTNPITAPEAGQEKKLPETRLQIWSFYFNYVLRNPFGVGPNTHSIQADSLKANGILNSGPHNTYLQIWLWGGLLGLVSFLFILFSAFRNLKVKLQSDFNYTALALLSILFVLSVSIMFDDSLGFYWFFIILALSLGK